MCAPWFNPAPAPPKKQNKTKQQDKFMVFSGSTSHSCLHKLNKAAHECVSMSGVCMYRRSKGCRSSSSALNSKVPEERRWLQKLVGKYIPLIFYWTVFFLSLSVHLVVFSPFVRMDHVLYAHQLENSPAAISSVSNVFCPKAQFSCHRCARGGLVSLFRCDVIVLQNKRSCHLLWDRSCFNSQLAR